MTGLRDYLEKRREEVRKRMAPTAAEAVELRAKLKALEAKLRDLAKEDAEIDAAILAIGKKEKREEATITIKEAILKVLADHPNGMTSREILTAINSKFFGALPRTSFSPQLTRLEKNDHKIKRKGDKHFLA